MKIVKMLATSIVAAVTLTAGVAATAQAAPALPSAPKFEFQQASCLVTDNFLTITNTDAAKHDRYRLLYDVPGQRTAFFRKADSEQILNSGGKFALNLYVEDTFGKPTLEQIYGKPATMTAYYFDRENAFPAMHADPATLPRAEKRMVKLTDAFDVTMLDPDKACQLPKAPTLTYAQKDNKNVITVTDAEAKYKEGYRFVVKAVDGSVTKLFPADVALQGVNSGKLVLEEAIAGLYGYYGKDYTVEIYYFDQARAFGAHHYVPLDSVVPGQQHERFIKLGTAPAFALAAPQATVAVDKPVVAADDDKVTFTAAGFMPGEEVTFEVHSTPVVAGAAVANQYGVATLNWQIPDTFKRGNHTVYAKGATSAKQAEAKLTLTAKAMPVNPTAPVAAAPATTSAAKQAATAKQLAKGGSQQLPFLGLASVLLAAAGVAAVAARRKTN